MTSRLWGQENDNLFYSVWWLQPPPPSTGFLSHPAVKVPCHPPPLSSLPDICNTWFTGSGGKFPHSLPPPPPHLLLLVLLPAQPETLNWLKGMESTFNFPPGSKECLPRIFFIIFSPSRETLDWIFNFFFIYLRYSTFLHLPPSDSTVSEDARIEPRTVATTALAVRHSDHSARPHPEILNSYQCGHRIRVVGTLKMV